MLFSARDVACLICASRTIRSLDYLTCNMNYPDIKFSYQYYYVFSGLVCVYGTVPQDGTLHPLNQAPRGGTCER